MHVLICLKVTFTWFFIIFKEEPRRTKKCLEYCWTTPPCQFPWLSLKIICRDMHANVRCKTWRWLKNIEHMTRSLFGSTRDYHKNHCPHHILSRQIRWSSPENSKFSRRNWCHSHREIRKGGWGKGEQGGFHFSMYILPWLSFSHEDSTWPKGVS